MLGTNYLGEAYLGQGYAAAAPASAKLESGSTLTAVGRLTARIQPELSGDSCFVVVGHIHFFVAKLGIDGGSSIEVHPITDYKAEASLSSSSTMDITGALILHFDARLSSSSTLTVIADAGYVAIQKTFMYKVYSKDGDFIKSWSREVISAYEEKVQINTSGSEVKIKLAREPDDYGEGVDIDYMNRVEISVVDSETPNGQLRFQGYISQYQPNYADSTVDLTVLGYGAELADYIIEDSSGNTTVAYNSKDPSDILRGLLDAYNDAGGTLSYDEDSIDDTGSTVSYTFNTNTIDEGISKVLELSPVGWYYYVDQANNKVHFHQRTDVIHHTFTLGKNISDMSIKKSMEDIVNTVYFSGGKDNNNEQIYRKYEIEASIDKYGIRGKRVKDSRVTLDSTADIIAEKNLRGDPEILVNLEVIDGNLNNDGYDIESVVLGQTIRISNAGYGPSSRYDIAKYDSAPFDYDLSNISSISFQITSLDYTADTLKFSLSTTPPDITKRIQDINRNLTDLQNNENPSLPTSVA